MGTHRSHTRYQSSAHGRVVQRGLDREDESRRRRI